MLSAACPPIHREMPRLGVIPAIAYCLLLVGVLGLFGSSIAVARSQDFIAIKEAANQTFYRDYWPLIASMSRDAGATELRELEEAMRRMRLEEA